ncbi:hypothetical protein BU26DRAFT_432676, partial [Trematosphaeria pertusa]
PLTTGLIIAASVIVAAGIAIYESPQVRQWVDQSRRKIAIALHSLGDEIQPRRPSESSDDYDSRKRRREELVKRNRNELIRRAREEGVAVDLDELARIGSEDIEMAERRQRRKTAASQRSFDQLVGSDGMLRRDDSTATGAEAMDNGLRKRGGACFAAGSAAANPFADENVLFDRDDEEAPSPKPFTYIEPGTASRETSATLEADGPASPPTASIPQSEADETDHAAQSFYSFTSSSHAAQAAPANNSEEEAEHISTGTLTPRSEHSAFTGASVVGSHADDIAVLSMQNDTDHDARSEGFSEGGFTEAGFSEAGFSELGQGDNRGIMTPSSWTDIGSDDESEFGGPAQGGQVSQVHQHP